MDVIQSNDFSALIGFIIINCKWERTMVDWKGDFAMFNVIYFDN